MITMNHLNSNATYEELNDLKDYFKLTNQEDDKNFYNFLNFIQNNLDKIGLIALDFYKNEKHNQTYYVFQLEDEQDSCFVIANYIYKECNHCIYDTSLQFNNTEKMQHKINLYNKLQTLEKEIEVLKTELTK